MRWCETAENRETNNDNDTGKINEDKKEGASVIEMGESGWGSCRPPPPREVPPAAGPSCEQ